jgi:hypothetical protein
MKLLKVKTNFSGVGIEKLAKAMCQQIASLLIALEAIQEGRNVAREKR